MNFIDTHKLCLLGSRSLTYLAVTIFVMTASSAQAQFTPLSCSGNELRHDWDTNAWPAGNLSQIYTSSGETLAFSISGDTTYFLPDSASAPTTSNYDSGGLSPAQQSLELWLDFDSLTQSVFLNVQIGQNGIGVEALQFSIFDVDFGEAQFQDQIIVTGSLDGSSVSPILTPSLANTVNANVATGQSASAETSPDANLGVTFTSPIDELTIQYTNGAAAPDPPGGQAISIHDITMCPRRMPELAASKTIETYDPLDEGLYNIPGSEVIYTIMIENKGNASTDEDSIFLNDTLPEEVVFFNGDFNDDNPGAHPVIFEASGTPELSFSPINDLKFSNMISPPTQFSDCNYIPVSGYDPDVKHVCFNPKGKFNHGTPAPKFSLKFRTLIK